MKAKVNKFLPLKRIVSGRTGIIYPVLLSPQIQSVWLGEVGF